MDAVLPDPSDFDAILKYLKPRLRRRADYLKHVAPVCMTIDDLLQVGYIGCWTAHTAWRTKVGDDIGRLLSVMTIRGQGAMLDEIEKNTWTRGSTKRWSRMTDHVSLERREGNEDSDEVHEQIDPVTPEDHLYAFQAVQHLIKVCSPYEFGARHEDQMRPHDLSILQLVAQGFEADEIAVTLNLSLWRVKRILNNIRKKAEKLP